MPKLIQYSRQVSPQQTIQARQATAADFNPTQGARATNELAGLGEGLMEIGQELKRQKDKQDAVAIEKGMIDAEIEFSKRMTQMEQDAPLGDSGYVDRVQGEFESSSQKISEQFGDISKENQQRLQLELTRMKSRVSRSAVSFQAKSVATKALSDVKDGLGLLQNQIRDGSISSVDGVARGEQLIAAGGLAAPVAGNALRGFRSQAHVAEFDGKIGRYGNDYEGIASLRDEVTKRKESMLPEDYDRTLDAINSAERQAKAASDEIEVADIKDHINARLNGGAGNGITVERIKALSDKKMANRLIKEFRRAEQVGEFADRITSMPPPEIDALERKLLHEFKNVEGGAQVEQAKLRVLDAERGRRRREGVLASDDIRAQLERVTDVGASKDEIAQIKKRITEKVPNEVERARLLTELDEAVNTGSFKQKARSASPVELDKMRNDLLNNPIDKGGARVRDLQVAILGAELNRRKTEEAFFVDSFEDDIFDISDGKYDTKIVDVLRKQIDEKVLNEVSRAKYHKALDLAVTQGEEFAAVDGRTVAENVARARELQDALDFSSGDKRDEVVARIEAFMEARKRQEERIKRDQARYAYENVKQVQDAHAALDAAREGDNPDAISQARRDYVVAQKAAQGRFGIHNNDVKLLRAEEVLQWSRIMKETADPKMPKGAYVFNELRKLQSFWKDDFVYINKQLQQAGVFTGTTAVAASVRDPAVAKNLLEIDANLKEKPDTYEVLSKRATTEQIRDAVFEKTKGLVDTLKKQPFGRSHIETYHQAIISLTKDYMLVDNMTADAAAEKAANDIINNQYEFAGTYRIPTGQGLDVGAVQHGADLALRRREGMDLSDIVLGPSSIFNQSVDEDRRAQLEQTIDSIRAKGYWGTSPDEDGLILYDPLGRPVFSRRTKGQVKMTWKQLEGIRVQTMRPDSGMRVRQTVKGLY